MSLFSWCLQPSWPKLGGDSRARGRTSAGDCESQRPAFARALQDAPTYLQSCMQGNFNLQNLWGGLKMGYTVIYSSNGHLKWDHENSKWDIGYQMAILYHFMGYTENHQLEFFGNLDLSENRIPQVIAIFMGKMITNRWIGEKTWFLGNMSRFNLRILWHGMRQKVKLPGKQMNHETFGTFYA